ncbi:WD40 repeat domain-containing protein [Endozoicomonas sp. YOMI1]|uniref:WD40 repeat domain-containing protein n=1 Tax=Endozoicomonas sp. YOMI1 TaxID=2828739 RepID=UPI00214779FA|nr:WD40 repeat domain-containing protein [Endozoicomonas sp. YOMI1]
MQPIASGSTAASRMETDERQSFNDLEPPHKSVAAHNKKISEIPDPEQIESLERLKLDSTPEWTVITTIDERKITGLNISMMPQSSDPGLAEASQQHEQRNIPCDSSSEPESAGNITVPSGDASANSGNTLTSLNRPSTDDSDTESSTDDSDTESSTDDSDTESAFRKAFTAEVSGAAANSDAPVPVNDEQLQGVALINSQSGKIDSMKAEIFQCKANYLELKQAINFGRYIRDAKFSPSGKNLAICGYDRKDDRVQGIWRQTADGSWSQNGKVRRDTFRFEFNQSENTLLSSSHDGSVTVSKLNSDGFWEEAVVLEHSPSIKGEDFLPVKAGFSPRQDKIMTYDPQTGKIKILREDSNGRWTLLNQAKEISHRRQWRSQQPPFKATDHYLLTYRGSTATVWEFNDDSNSLEEKKVIECSRKILSAQMSDDEEYAALFGGNQVIFLGCDVDGDWSQIGEVLHTECFLKDSNKHGTGLVCEASFNASRQYALSLDSNNKAIISGYDENGSWVVKTEIQDCAKARFSSSGRKLLVHLFKPQDCNNTDDQLDTGQTPEQSGDREGFIRRNYGNFKLWDCSSAGDPLDKAQTLEHSGSDHAIFSPSENFLLSYGFESNFACIWGYDEEGNLVQKAKLCHQVRINDAAFNAQDDSVLTRGDGQVVKIHGLDSQGKWQEQLLVQHQRNVCDAQFSSSGHLAYTVSLGGTACILGRDNHDKWMKQAMTNVVDGYSIAGAHFNGLENHFLTYGNKINKKDKHQPGLVQLWGIGDDGKWAEIEQIKLDYPVKLAKFSPDSVHLLIQCNDDRRGTFLSKNGIALLWKIPARPGQETAHT